jgi:hypothetical protein
MLFHDVRHPETGRLTLRRGLADINTLDSLAEAPVPNKRAQPRFTESLSPASNSLDQKGATAMLGGPAPNRATPSPVAAVRVLPPGR